jgi:hypothetical protein
MRLRVREVLYLPTCAEFRRKPMKRAIRMLILTVGLVGTFVLATVELLPAADGGPILVCPPKQKSCQGQLPLQ